MPKAKARHILVAKEDRCMDLKERIENGEEFSELAKTHSLCPSGKEGGELGEFSKGDMVPEFDEAVFSGKVGEVQGPIQTQFGFHLLEVTEREE